MGGRLEVHLTNYIARTTIIQRHEMDDDESQLILELYTTHNKTLMAVYVRS